MNRISPVAGTFYQDDEDSLTKEIEDLFKHPLGVGDHPFDLKPLIKDSDFLGIISPHAGYKFSGPIASHSYSYLYQRMPDLETAIIVGPNHRGFRPKVSIFPEGNWIFPNGTVGMDETIIDYLKNESDGEYLKIVEFDGESQRFEHSIDVQIPFLLHLYGSDIKIVPVCIAEQNLENSKILAAMIADVLSKFKDQKIAVIASSDLSHEQDYDHLEKQDKEMTELILRADLAEISEFKSKKNVTMCGYGAVYTLIDLAEKLGMPEIELLSYANNRIISPSTWTGYTVGYPSFSVEII